MRTQIDGPTDGPFEQAIRWDGNTRESPLAAAHATNFAAPLGYRLQYRNETNTPHITVARSRVNDTITSTVLSVAMAFFTQQFICEDFLICAILCYRTGEGDTISRCVTPCTVVEIYRRFIQVLCNVGNHHSTRRHIPEDLKLRPHPCRTFSFAQLYWWLTIKYYTASPFESTPTIRNRKQMQLSHARRSAWQMFQVKCLTDCGRSVCLTVAATSACR